MTWTCYGWHSWELEHALVKWHKLVIHSFSFDFHPPSFSAQLNHVSVLANSNPLVDEDCLASLAQLQAQAVQNSWGTLTCLPLIKDLSEYLLCMGQATQLTMAEVQLSCSRLHCSALRPSTRHSSLLAVTGRFHHKMSQRRLRQKVRLTSYSLELLGSEVNI